MFVDFPYDSASFLFWVIVCMWSRVWSCAESRMIGAASIWVDRVAGCYGDLIPSGDPSVYYFMYV